MSDVLAGQTVQDVHAWYLRLADMAGKNKVGGLDPLSSQFLHAYLRNKNPNALLTFTSPPYLQTAPETKAALLYQRRVFLSEEKGRIGTANLFGNVPEKWVGVVPRLQDGRWNGQTSLTMQYASLVEFGSSLADIYRIQRSGTPAERDLFTSLRGFQLHSDVTIAGTRTGDTVQVEFRSWQTRAKDRYDWNYDEYLTMPNPDFGSTKPGAIEPHQREVRVYHKNAKRMEDAKLAAPYDLVVGPWTVRDPKVLAKGTVDATKKL